MQYRKMVISDYDKVVALWKKSEGVQLRDADSKEGFIKYLERNPGLSFVCEIDENIVATIMSGHDGKRGYVQHLAVSEMFRKHGIGSCLITKCLGALKEENILKSHIHVLATNESAKVFWQNKSWKKRTDLEVYSFINGSSENT